MSHHFTLDHQAIQFDSSYLPCLISGACKSGASYFSVSLVADLILGGAKVIFFTAFPMAKEELLRQIGPDYTVDLNDPSDLNKIPDSKSIIIQSGNLDLFTQLIKTVNNLKEYIIFVKNIEVYDSSSLLNLLTTQQHIIFSGDIDQCNFVDYLQEQLRATIIIFTQPKIFTLNYKLPQLSKYESFLYTAKKHGILRTETI